jgi:hypothetical protein
LLGGTNTAATIVGGGARRDGEKIGRSCVTDRERSGTNCNGLPVGAESPAGPARPTGCGDHAATPWPMAFSTESTTIGPVAAGVAGPPKKVARMPANNPTIVATRLTDLSSGNLDHAVERSGRDGIQSTIGYRCTRYPTKIMASSGKLSQESHMLCLHDGS